MARPNDLGSHQARTSSGGEGSLWPTRQFPPQRLPHRRLVGGQLHLLHHRLPAFVHWGKVTEFSRVIHLPRKTHARQLTNEMHRWRSIGATSSGGVNGMLDRITRDVGWLPCCRGTSVC